MLIEQQVISEMLMLLKTTPMFCTGVANNIGGSIIEECESGKLDDIMS